MSLFIPVVLCGGAGSRLWPVSREQHPKPFMRLADGQSLLQKAYLRGALLPEACEVLTITNRELLFSTEDEYRPVRQAGIAHRYVLEPVGRNTAAAVATAALVTEQSHGPQAVMLVLPADHLLQDAVAFAQAVARARQLAEQGRLVTFGIRPTTPETGYGYIEADGEDVIRFVEKPDLSAAQAYLASGRHLWNAGMFCFTAGAILQELNTHCPELLAATRLCLSHSATAAGQGYEQTVLDPEHFARVPQDSIDYAVMEKSSQLKVIACDPGWSDIGSWRAVSELTGPDARGNRIQGQAILHETSDCYVQSPDRLVGLVGVDNLVIIDTPDALLVADKHHSQDVRHLYNQLKTLGHEASRVHATVHRPWGTYTVLDEGPGFKIKRIEVKPGASLSLQMHHHRSEHWVVVSGTAMVVNGEREIMVRPNESTYIPAGHQHRLTNPGILPLVMIEVQSGQYLGEDDIVRFSDQYGRAPAP